MPAVKRALSPERFAEFERVQDPTYRWLRSGAARFGAKQDATIKALGIPLARVGPPPPTDHTPPEWRLGLGGMGVAHVPDLVRVSKLLVYTAIDSCLRDRKEVGL